jgi:hypothetical protein
MASEGERVMGWIRKILCGLAVLASLPASAVNLVPNPSFETYTQCPTDGLFSPISFAPPWSSPTLASPDYFNACSGPLSGMGVPVNIAGNQSARTGSAYAGFSTQEGDRTYKLHSDTTSEYGRYVKYPGGAP